MSQLAPSVVVPQRYLPVLATSALLVVMFAVGAVRYDGFASGQVVLWPTAGPAPKPSASTAASGDRSTARRGLTPPPPSVCSERGA